MNGANGEGRTPMALRPPDPKSGASASSATFAKGPVRLRIATASPVRPAVRCESFAPFRILVIAGAMRDVACRSIVALTVVFLASHGAALGHS
jgi:hypothetical protein